LGGAAWLAQAGAFNWVTDRVNRVGNLLMAGLDEAAMGLGLVVEEVWVTGRVEADGAELLAALDVRRGTPILRFDPVSARARVEALGWVREASVQRILPNQIHLHIVERRPIALWQHGGRMVLIGPDAVTITERDLGRFTNLPLLVGDDAPQHATELFDVLAAEPRLEKRVVSAVRIGKRRWNLKLDNDIEVRLPERDPLAAWLRMAALDREENLLARDIAVLDLRLPDRVVLRLGHDAAREALTGKDGHAAPRKKPAPGQNT